MSTKWLARAACDGQGLVIIMPGPVTFAGFLVGMDDYHLKIAQVIDGEVVVGLAHKAAGFISIAPDLILSNQNEPIQSEVKKIGQSFWNVCAETYLGKNGNKESQ